MAISGVVGFSLNVSEIKSERRRAIYFLKFIYLNTDENCLSLTYQESGLIGNFRALIHTPIFPINTLFTYTLDSIMRFVLLLIP